MIMKFLLLFFVFSTPTLADNIGTIKYGDHTVNIVGTYSIFNEKNRELTIHLLACKYSEELKSGWKSESGFLKCYPISENDYFSAPGASISIKLNDKKKAGRVIFSTTKIGEKDSYHYHGFSKSWFRNSPIEGPIIKGDDNIDFSIAFEVPDKNFIVSLNVNTIINERIK